MNKFLNAALVLLISVQSTQAFLPARQNVQSVSSLQMSTGQNLVVISPPGGVGEVAAVQAAKSGSAVKWFVVSPPEQTASAVTISSQTLESINSDGKGGSLELAGAAADTLLLAEDDPASALKAVSTWCSNANGIICAVDGIAEAVVKAARVPGANPKSLEQGELNKVNTVVENAIKVAAKKACSSPSTMKIAVIPATMDALKVKDVGSEDEEEEEGPGFLSSLFSGGKVEVPSSLSKAMKSSGRNFATLRYGELFGIPESSPDASPLVGGPRRYPIIRDEYTMKSVRIDPTLSLSGSAIDGDTRSSRFSVGEAAVRMALSSSSKLNVDDNLDICLTSLRGLDTPSEEEWIGEFSRVQDMLSSGMGAQLFSASFGSVPSIDRLSDWVATKWAPAVMKTYDIAGIRVGGRPVYASVTGEGKVEIVWQELIDFKSVNVGKMIIEINDNGITAVRGPGDAKSGYGTISPKPLQGEDILVRRLADAATQAMEKGLATRPAPKARVKKEVTEAAVVSTVVSAGPVDVPATPAPAASSETGPRSSGARRSSERARGKRRKRSKKD